MPASEGILSWATAVANDWQLLAIGWHIALAALLIAFASGWRPSARLLGLLLVLPVVSVALLAALSRNPFNALTFTGLSALLLRAAGSLPSTAAPRTSFEWTAAGAALVAYGAVYPHFLRTDAWWAYAYASPFGLLPCPTLAVVIGITIVSGGFHSARWSLTLASAGLLYGLIGVLALRVPLDWGLMAGAAVLAVHFMTRRIVFRV